MGDLYEVTCKMKNKNHVSCTMTATQKNYKTATTCSSVILNQAGRQFSKEACLLEVMPGTVSLNYIQKMRIHSLSSHARQHHYS